MWRQVLWRPDNPRSLLRRVHSPLSNPPLTESPQVDIVLAPGSHDSEAAVNKQLGDKERVAAALENPNLLEMVNACIAGAAPA